MNKEDQRRYIDIVQKEYELGYADRRLPSLKINEYIKCFGGDNWINSQIHKYNSIKDREKYE